MRELTRRCCQKCTKYRLSQNSHKTGHITCEDTACLQAEKERLETEIRILHKKNSELEETVAWMHDLIWDLTRRLHSQPK